MNYLAVCAFNLVIFAGLYVVKVVSAYCLLLVLLVREFVLCVWYLVGNFLCVCEIGCGM